MDNEKDEKQLRFTFVAMLFALTIGKIAEEFAQLVYVGVGFSHPAYTHLLLATWLVVTRWVGWARSKAPGNILAVRDIFSWGFVVLLIDLFLVLCYFIIVKGAEIPKTKAEMEPSAANETLWVAIVFAGYFLWDFITKVIVGSTASSTFWNRLLSKYSLTNLIITFSFATAAILIWVFLCMISSHAGVIIVDVALMVIVFIFRALKQFVGRESSPVVGSPG